MDHGDDELQIIDGSAFVTIPMRISSILPLRGSLDVLQIALMNMDKSFCLKAVRLLLLSNIDSAKA